MSSADIKWDRDVARDPLPPWGDRSGSGDGELDHFRATNDSVVDHTRSGGGKQTISASGINVVIVGDRETNANLGDDVWDYDGAYDDDEVDRTGSGSGERTTSVGGINVVIVGDRETNASLGDGVP
jgi:hypothetical protein